MEYERSCGAVVYTVINDTVKYGDSVGYSSDYVRFEYCNTYKGESRWSVRIADLDFYKKDPMSLVDGTEHFPTPDELNPYIFDASGDVVDVAGYIVWDEGEPKPTQLPDTIYEELQPDEVTISEGMKD